MKPYLGPFHLLYYNPLACHELWVDLLPMHDFYDFYHHALFACRMLAVSYTSLPNVATFHHIASKKSHLLISPLISSEKSVRFEAVKLMVTDTEFSNIWIFPWKLKFYHWQQILSLVFLEVTGSRCLFLRKCLPDTQIWIIILCWSFIPIKGVFHGKSS